MLAMHTPHPQHMPVTMAMRYPGDVPVSVPGRDRVKMKREEKE